MGTLARGLDILELFAGDSPELTQTEISERLGLPVPTVHRLVKLLSERGWLARDSATRKLRLGLGAARLLPAVRLPDLARDPLRAMAERSGETVNLATLDGAEVLYLVSEAGSHLLTLRSHVGLRLPAHATALGKCLLAQLDDDEARRAVGRGPYTALTPRTVTTWEKLRSQLERVRREGVAYSREEYEVGLALDRRPARVGGGGRSGGGERLAAVLARGPRGHRRAHPRAAGRGGQDHGSGGVSAGTTPFWLDAPYEPRSALEGDVEVEACVIGGGVAGLSCARRLAQHGIETVLLEARHGRGRRQRAQRRLSDRRDGRRSTTTPASASARSAARAMYARTLDAQQDVYELAAELGAGESLRRVGMLRLAVSEEEAEHVRGQAGALREDGFPAELVEREELPPALRRSGLVGCLTEHDGALHPARWYRLARRCRRGGRRADLRGDGRARAGGGAGEGPVARELAAACAPATSSWPPTARCRRSCPSTPGRVRSRRLHMVATEPLPPMLEHARLRALGLRVPPAAPRRAHPRGRLQRRGRRGLLHGQRRGQPGDLGARRALPARRARRGRRGNHRWAGVVGYSEDSLPYVGEVPGRPRLYVSGGYSGVGNVPGFMCGRDIADTIAGERPEPLFPRTGSGGRERIIELSEREGELFAERTRGSEAMFRRAQQLAGRRRRVVLSTRRDPWPVYLERGEGARVWDVDGNEYLDFHNGFSAMVQGHAHPAIVAAVASRQSHGHPLRRADGGRGGGGGGADAAVRPPALALHELGHRVDMDAIRVARGLTGRERGGADGRRLPRPRDTTMVAWPEPCTEVRRRRGAGHTVPFNDRAHAAPGDSSGPPA